MSLEPSGTSSYSDVRNPLLLKRGLLIYASMILILGWSYGLWQIRADRARTLAASSNQLVMSATILAGNMQAMINDGVGAAAAGASEVRTLDQAAALSTDQMKAILARMLTGGEYVHTLFIVTPTRFIAVQRHDSSAPPLPADWSAQLLAASGDTWIGDPLNTAQGDLHVLIPLAKRVSSIRGEPTWAGALLSVGSLDRMYRSLPIERSAVSLVKPDGTLLIRLPTTPGTQHAGMDLQHYEAFRKYQGISPEPTTLDAPDPLSGKPRQFAIRRIEPYEVYSVSGRNEEDSLLAWQQRRSSSMVMLSIASFAILLLTGTLYLVLQRRFAAITHSEQRFQLAIAGTNDGIWEWEIRSNEVYYSPRYRQLLGVPDGATYRAEVTSFWESLHSDDKRTVELALQRHLLHRDVYDVEFRLRTHSGEYRWFRGRGQAVWDERGEPVRMAGSINDVHDKKLAEANLEHARQAELSVREELTQKLLLAQEQERQRLANELHDSVGQNLSLIKNHVLLLQRSELQSSAARHAAALEALASEVISEVRVVAHNLRPLIEELGLTDALSTLVAKVGQSGNLVIDGHLEDVHDVIQGGVATHLYRIAQEALNNVLKHASATHCQVTLERDINCVRLIVKDNGVGFDVNSRGGSHGIGLSSIAERARMLRAELRVQSAIDKGTAIHIEVPVTEAEASMTA